MANDDYTGPADPSEAPPAPAPAFPQGPQAFISGPNAYGPPTPAGPVSGFGNMIARKRPADYSVDPNMSTGAGDDYRGDSNNTAAPARPGPRET